ncbi:SOS response-associated peptidase [Alsobacter sp. SYSU M60028]|uniref:Abasic site processing protein n=1 Tax=Alsobacter ponti TaxID=2962936 RepID=A0ABT1LC18_9HYPH|nr:SOS response-associated peptidase [Alsobacter ponti]MCP8939044.1 SOS response-associated peptidase [Alsobacter ponti]
MCGRFSLSVTPQDLRAFFRYEDQPNFPARTNVSPTEPIGVILGRGTARRFQLMRWGFIPAWVKDPSEFPLLFNARGETIADKPAFRHAARRRRCIVPADGFYEWRREAKGKQPWLVTRRDGKPMAMAGLWETYVDREGGEIDTALVVTTDANGPVSALHDRMPVILEEADFDTWLDTSDEDLREAMKLVRPAADDVLAMTPCDPRLPLSERVRFSAPRPEPAAPAKPRKAKGGDDGGQQSLF